MPLAPFNPFLVRFIQLGQQVFSVKKQKPATTHLYCCMGLLFVPCKTGDRNDHGQHEVIVYFPKWQIN